MRHIDRGRFFRRLPVMVLFASINWCHLACKEQAPAGAESGGDSPAQLADATLGTSAIAGRRLVARDEEDDPAAPACLPRSDVVVGWVKTRAARVTPAAQFLEGLGDSLRAAELRRYRIVEATDCLYQKVTNGARFSLAVEMLRCASSDDAFGLYTTQRVGGPVGHTGRAWAHCRNDSYFLYAWQSEYMVRAEARPAGDYRIMADAERLMARLLLALPEAEPPKLLRYLPTAGRNPEAQWFARSCASLAGPGTHLVPAEQADTLDDVLGLDRALGIAVVAYHAGQDEPPNYLWLAEYASAADAEEAYRRYRAVIEQSASGNRSVAAVPETLLTSPVGRFLAGSWSPEQESVMHLLPVCRATLGKVVSSSG